MNDKTKNAVTNLGSFLIVACIFVSVNFLCTRDHESSYGEDQEDFQQRNEQEKHESEEEKAANKNDNDCGVEDGTHSATVDYYNPSTGRTATYTLDVEVGDCEVTEIDFPKGGWLDSDHIPATELNSNGDADIVDDRGRTFSVHIDD